MEKVLELADKVEKAGGRALLVGGCVRDEILQRPTKDIDVEVYGLSVEKLEEVLAEFGEVNNVGKSFAVYKLGQDIDVSLPRKDRKVGDGHKGFEVVSDPYMSFEEACSRRDFTINAILKDPRTGEIIDPCGGLIDLDMKMMRVVSEQSFQEDSLRVLRLAQFASRFNFDIEERTFQLAKETDLSDLPKERIWMEMEKLLLKSPNPAVGVADVFSLGIATKCFPSLEIYDELWVALYRAVHFCNDITEEEKLTVLLVILTWASDPQVMEELGVTSVNGYNVRKVVDALLKGAPEDRLYNDYMYHKMSQTLPMKLMSKLMFAYNNEDAEEFASTIERLGIEEKPVEPIMKGKDLIALGMEPSAQMGEVLEKLYDAQLRGFNEYELKNYAQKLTDRGVAAQ